MTNMARLAASVELLDDDLKNRPADPHKFQMVACKGRMCWPLANGNVWMAIQLSAPPGTTPIHIFAFEVRDEQELLVDAETTLMKFRNELANGKLRNYPKTDNLVTK